MTDVFGRLVRRIRGEREITQQELGASIGCTNTFISHIECGVREPGLTMALRLEAALQISPTLAAEFLLLAAGHDEENINRVLKGTGMIQSLKPGEVLKLGIEDGEVIISRSWQ